MNSANQVTKKPSKWIWIVIGTTVGIVVIVLVVVLAVVLTPKNSKSSNSQSSKSSNSSGSLNSSSAPYNFLKIIGTPGSVSLQGAYVAVSGDGTTVALGAPNDNGSIGAAYIFTNNNGIWVQQAKLIGSNNIGSSYMGPVSLSANGNTLALGGSLDHNGIGSVWVFTRSGTTWTQVAQLISGSNTVGQGSSLSLSGDGNTLAVGAPEFGLGVDVGAIFVWTFSGNSWTQKTTLQGNGNSGASYQGSSVALSLDGKTIVIGGPNDNNNQGAVWVFTLNGTTWIQNGSKLVNIGFTNFGSAVAVDGIGITFAATVNGYSGNVMVYSLISGVWQIQQNIYPSDINPSGNSGTSVALTSDGNILVLGNAADNSNTGAFWIFNRNNGINWLQNGSKKVGSLAIGPALQGIGVGVSSNADVIVEGGPYDNSQQGAGWIYQN